MIGHLQVPPGGLSRRGRLWRLVLISVTDDPLHQANRPSITASHMIFQTLPERGMPVGANRAEKEPDGDGLGSRVLGLSARLLECVSLS